LGERLNGIQEVVSSSLIVSISEKADKHNVYQLFAFCVFENFEPCYWTILEYGTDYHQNPANAFE